MNMLIMIIECLGQERLDVPTDIVDDQGRRSEKPVEGFLKIQRTYFEADWIGFATGLGDRGDMAACVMENARRLDDGRKAPENVPLFIDPCYLFIDCDSGVVLHDPRERMLELDIAEQVWLLRNPHWPPQPYLRQPLLGKICADARQRAYDPATGRIRRVLTGHSRTRVVLP